MSTDWSLKNVSQKSVQILETVGTKITFKQIRKLIFKQEKVSKSACENSLG